MRVSAGRIATGVVALLGWLAAAVLFATRPRERMEVVDIDVNHGLSDCPWPPGVRDPNGEANHDPKSPDWPGEVDKKNAYLVLRDDDKILLAEPVREVRCVRPSPGPDIMIELNPNLGPLGDDVPPAVDPNVVAGCRDASTGVTAYRRVRKLLHDMRITDPMAFQRVEDWYQGNHHGEWEEGELLQPMGKTAISTYFVTLWDCEPIVQIDVHFFREEKDEHVCVPLSMGPRAAPTLPRCTARAPLPDAGQE